MFMFDFRFPKVIFGAAALLCSDSERPLAINNAEAHRLQTLLEKTPDAKHKDQEGPRTA